MFFELLTASSGPPHRNTLFWGTWNGHSDSTPPVLDDSVSTMIWGEIEANSGFNYGQLGAGSMYSLPAALATAYGQHYGSFTTWEFWTE